MRPVGEISIAIWFYGTGRRCEKCSTTWLARSRVERNSDVHGRPIAQRKKLVVVDHAGVALVVVPDLVVADVRSWQDSEIHAEPIGVNRRFHILKQERFRPFVKARERGPFSDVARISQPERPLQSGQQQKVLIPQFPPGVVKMRRSRDDWREPRRRIGNRGRGRIYRVCLKRVVPEVLVLPEERVEVVPLVPADPQTRHAVWLATVAKVAEVQPVE